MKQEIKFAVFSFQFFILFNLGLTELNLMISFYD